MGKVYECFNKYIIITEKSEFQIQFFCTECNVFLSIELLPATVMQTLKGLVKVLILHDQVYCCKELS